MLGTVPESALLSATPWPWGYASYSSPVFGNDTTSHFHADLSWINDVSLMQHFTAVSVLPACGVGACRLGKGNKAACYTLFLP